jgi:putative SOS response-associated peptidase YedK
MAKRIPKESIVYGSERVLTADQLDLIRWYHPREVIIVGQDEESEYLITGSGVPKGINTLTGSLFPKVGLSGPTGPTGPKIVVEEKDVPELTDIESVTYTKYFDPATKVEKAKAVIKIRNSSKNKKNIAGVDARILPKGE